MAIIVSTCAKKCNSIYLSAFLVRDGFKYVIKCFPGLETGWANQQQVTPGQEGVSSRRMWPFSGRDKDGIYDRPYHGEIRRSPSPGHPATHCCPRKWMNSLFFSLAFTISAQCILEDVAKKKSKQNLQEEQLVFHQLPTKSGLLQRVWAPWIHHNL